MLDVKQRAVLGEGRAVAYVIGVDLGGTKIASALANEKGDILASDTRLTLAADGIEAVLARIEGAVHKVACQSGVPFTSVIGVGIGAPSPVQTAAGIVSQAPNLPGWIDIPLKTLMEKRLGIPVVVGNDANATAQAEYRFGAGLGTRNMVYITASTGIGGGFILDGRLYEGSDGAAGEVGHTIVQDDGPLCGCGNYGCWEALASGTALARDAQAAIATGAALGLARISQQAGGKITAALVYQAACSGDCVAQLLVANTARWLGVGLVNLVNIFNPEMVVVGGGMSNMGEMLLGPAREVVRTRARALAAGRAQIVRAALGDRGPVLGAVALALGANLT
jgi:glucokinase